MDKNGDFRKVANEMYRNVESNKMNNLKVINRPQPSERSLFLDLFFKPQMAPAVDWLRTDRLHQDVLVESDMNVLLAPGKGVVSLYSFFL